MDVKVNGASSPAPYGLFCRYHREEFFSEVESRVHLPPNAADVVTFSDIFPFGKL